MNRRACLSTIAASVMAGRSAFTQTTQRTDSQNAADVPAQNESKDWVCPMDPDYRSNAPGVCPRCGMKLVLGIPERVDFPMQVTHSPAVLRPGENATLRLRVLDPQSGDTERHFEIVHEKLMHLFLVSENLEYFAHVHPVLQPDGSFELPVCLPEGGMYRMLADFYPAQSVPQLAVATIYVDGKPKPAQLTPSLAPCQSTNLTAALKLEPEKPLAGLESRLEFTLDPAEGIERYLGAWGHMLAASADLIDLIHVHPFLTDQQGHMQFNLIFPRSGMYRVWTQFQRLGLVDTTQFTIPVGAI